MFENKVVLITGGGSGIGAASARAFAKQGAKLMIAEINQENIDLISAEFSESETEAAFIKTDVSNFEQVDQMIKHTVNRFGSVDVLINNAGIANIKMVKTADHTLEDWERVIAVNQTGVFYCMKLALKQMMAQGQGNIVNVASLAGLKASGNNLAYSASKFAVVGMTKSAALEYASKNIRINCVCPGYTHTALFDAVLEKDKTLHDRLLRYIPMGKYGNVDQIAEAILWLASEKTNYITGQAITLDGGLSL